MTSLRLDFLPSLGMTGFYSLAAPYDKLISPTAQYRCEAVKSLRAAISEGQDPLNTVYLENGDTVEKYDADVQADVSLVTISAADGALIVFPHNVLLQVPAADGVVYSNTVLSVALGALDQRQDLTELQEQIKQLILDGFGLESESFISVVGQDAIITPERHQDILAARQAKIDQQESMLAKNVRLQSQLNQALQKIQELEQYILSLEN